MAIYHLHANIISRGKGQSSIASTAYRLCERMHDDRLNKTNDYRPKGWQLEGYFTVCADKLTDFEDIRDIENYLNKLEKFEKRYDAQLLRELEVAIPKEFSETDSIFVFNDFLKPLCNQYGIRAICAIHNKADGNPHAHILLTLREEESLGKTASENVQFGKKIREMNTRNWIKEQRKRWADCCNKYLDKDNQIDSRTYEEQGVSKIPTAHVGWRVGLKNDLTYPERLQKKSKQNILEKTKNRFGNEKKEIKINYTSKTKKRNQNRNEYDR